MGATTTLPASINLAAVGDTITETGDAATIVAGSGTTTVNFDDTVISVSSTVVGSISPGQALPATGFNTVVGPLTVTAVGEGNTTLEFVSQNTSVAPTVSIPVTVGVTEDESYLNKRGLTHFWENVDNLKQDKLTVGSNITISDENVISAVQPTVDSSLSFSSTNAVENQAIKNVIYDKNSSNDKEAGVNVEFSNPALSPYVHIGSKSSATKGNSSVGIGYDAESSAIRSVAIGPSATVTKREGVALGANATAGQYSLSIGYYTNTVPNYSTAVGPYAKVLTGATNATAIGYQSEASEAETISVGKSTNKRRIVNVADGTTATDAATVGQIPVVITDEEIDSIVESS